MECRTDDNRNYDVVKAKIPKRDKAGNDISSDKMGPGGRRKEDGTLSALAYDFELVEDSKDFGPDDTEEMLRQYAWEDQQQRDAQADDFLVMLDNISAVVDAVATFLEAHPDIAVKIVDGVVTFGRTVAGQFQTIKTKLMPKKASKPRKHTQKKYAARITTKAEQLLVKTEETRQRPKATMTIEEARREVIAMLGHYIELKKGFQRLSNANVIDPGKLGFDGIIDYLEGIVSQYPALLDKATEASILSFNFDELEQTRVKEVLELQKPCPPRESKSPHPLHHRKLVI